MKGDCLRAFLGIEECCKSSVDLSYRATSPGGYIRDLRVSIGPVSSIIVSKSCHKAISTFSPSKRTWRNTVNSNPSICQLLRHASSEVLHRRLASSIWSITPRKRPKKSRDDRDNFAFVFNVFGRLFEKEECTLRIHPTSIHTLATHHAGGRPGRIEDKTYANITSYSSSLTSTIGFFSTMPTVLTNISTLPCSCKTSSNNF